MYRAFALFVSATVVFAPGWGPDETSNDPRTSLDLAGRILAPTFGEARTRQEESTRALKASDSQEELLASSAAMPATSGFASPPLAQVPAVTGLHFATANGGPPPSFSSRAPPSPTF